MKKITLNPDLLQMCQDFLGFVPDAHMSRLEYFHHSGPWLFLKLYEHFGLNGSMQLDENRMVFQIDKRKISQKKYIDRGWFTLSKIMPGAVLNLGNIISFYHSERLPAVSGVFEPRLSLSVGYNIPNEADTVEGLNLATNLGSIAQNECIPLFHYYIGKESTRLHKDSLRVERFISRELAERLIMPVVTELSKRFDKNRINEYRESCMQAIS
jgi:hypothetical protein